MGPNNKNDFSKHSLASAADLYIHKTFFKDTRKYNKIAYLSQVPPQESAERGVPAAAANDIGLASQKSNRHGRNRNQQTI